MPPIEAQRTIPRLHRRTARTAIRDGEIHIRHGSLSEGGSPVTPAEERRARAMRSGRRRREFLICRGALRRLLARTLGVHPLAIPLVEGRHGKPAIGLGAGVPDRLSRIGFNLSHSGERYVVAAALDMAPGVDIERIRPRRDLARLTRRFFSPRERQEVAAADDPLRAFHRVWSRKEAVIKADGRGVAIGLARFDVTAGHPPALLHARWTGAAPDEAAHWSLHELDVSEEYAAALAVRRKGVVVIEGTADDPTEA